MFIKQNDPIPIIKENPLLNIGVDDEESTEGGSSHTGTHSQYRTNYPMSIDPHALEDMFFKTLESILD